MVIYNGLNTTGYSIQSYGPIHEWVSIFAQALWVIQYNINHGLIREWEYVFAKLLLVKYTINYGPVCIYLRMGIQHM